MNKKLKNILAITGAATVTAAVVYGLNVLDEKKDKKRWRSALTPGRNRCGQGSGDCRSRRTACSRTDWSTEA